MDFSSAVIIIILAALVHATFQLSVSVLTLLSGHALGTRMAQSRLLRRMLGFSFGAACMTLLLTATTTYKLDTLYLQQPPLYVAAIVYAFLISVGMAVWVYYFRKNAGTSLWLPRGLARLLHSRAKATTSSAEAFSLGLTSVLAELIFIIGPVAACSVALVSLPEHWQLAGLALYVLLATLPLLIVTSLIHRGYKLSRIQKWRETHKGFLQFIAGAGLIVLGFYLYTSEIMTTVVYTQGL